MLVLPGTSMQGKKVLEAQKSMQQSIAVAVKKVNDDIYLKGETLPEKELVFRCEVVQTFLRAGVPLSKVQQLRPLLERGGSRLADRSVLTRQCLLAILHTERSHIQPAIGCRTPTAQSRFSDDCQGCAS